MQETCSGNPASIKRILRQQVGYFFLEKKSNKQEENLGLFTRDGKIGIIYKGWKSRWKKGCGPMQSGGKYW